MSAVDFTIIVVCVAVYTGAVTFVFVGLSEIRRQRREAAEDLAEMRQHQRRVVEALALWNYGAHEEAIEILRDEGFSVRQERLDAE